MFLQHSCQPEPDPANLYQRGPQYISLNVAASTILQNLFHLPLSNKAYARFQKLSVILQNLQLSQAIDVWSYIWGSPTLFLQ